MESFALTEILFMQMQLISFLKFLWRDQSGTKITVQDSMNFWCQWVHTKIWIRYKLMIPMMIPCSYSFPFNYELNGIPFGS